jgi:hypothetical protein
MKSCLVNCNCPLNISSSMVFALSRTRDLLRLTLNFLKLAPIPIDRNLRHLELCKAKDGTCILVKVASGDNYSDIGTKGVPISNFNKVTSPIVDRSLGNNL